jgi:hypothetical protein
MGWLVEANLSERRVVSIFRAEVMSRDWEGQYLYSVVVGEVWRKQLPLLQLYIYIYIYIYGHSQSRLITSALKMEIARLSETLASTNQCTRRRSPKEHQYRHHRENLKSNMSRVGMKNSLYRQRRDYETWKLDLYECESVFFSWAPATLQPEAPHCTPPRPLLARGTVNPTTVVPPSGESTSYTTLNKRVLANHPQGDCRRPERSWNRDVLLFFFFLQLRGFLKNVSAPFPRKLSCGCTHPCLKK